MAYAATVTYIPDITTLDAGIVLQPGAHLRVRIAETDCASTSEATIALGVPCFFSVLAQRGKITSGTGATLDPILGTATAPAGVEVVAENGTAADPVNNAPTGGAPGYTSTGTLYHRSRPNAGTDNVITTEYILRIDRRA